MTYKAFLAAVKKAGPWTFWKSGNAKQIVLARNEMTCPWLAVRPTYGPEAQLSRRGASPVRAQMVWDAADERPRHNKAIRRDLLRACGLLSPQAKRPSRTP